MVNRTIKELLAIERKERPISERNLIFIPVKMTQEDYGVFKEDTYIPGLKGETYECLKNNNKNTL